MFFGKNIFFEKINLFSKKIIYSLYIHVIMDLRNIVI